MLANTSFNFERQKYTRKSPSKPIDIVEPIPSKDSGDCSMDIDELTENTSTSSSELNILNEPLYLELIHFFHLLLQQSYDTNFSPRSLVPLAVLEQIILCLREDSNQFLRFISFQLLKSIIRTMPNQITFEQLLVYLPLENARGRKTGSKLLCQLQLSKLYGT